MSAAIDDGEGLTPAQQAAVDFCEALISQPGAISTELAERLRHHFSDEQLTELALDVMKWSYQKVAVVLGTDPEINEGELTDLVFDENGDWVR